MTKKTLLILMGAALLLLLVIGQKNSKQARWRAMSKGCEQSLQWLGQSAQKWANEHQDTLPPDLMSLTNQLGSPVALICPADGGKIYQVNRETWQGFDFKSASYEFLAPGKSIRQVRTQAVFRCQVHKHEFDGGGKVTLQPLPPPPKNLAIYE